jgi:Putative beta-barrel porin-2, OmpL-like. bbp2
MKCNRWTVALIGAGLVSLPAVTQAEEQVNSVLTALSSTTLSGYVDTSAQWNLGTGNANVPDYAFGGPSKADGFNLNVVKLSLAHPVDAKDVWGAGYQVDLLFGPDADSFATQSLFGNGSPSSSPGDFAVRQAYVDLHAPVGNGLDVKVGVFDTIIGYEVFDSINNPNFTRSYGYTMEPTTHTGVLASYQFCDYFSASAGVADTFGPQINQRAFPPFGTRAESYKTYMGSMTFTAPKAWGFLAGSTLSAGLINGFNSVSPGAAGGGPGDQTSYYVGTTLNTPLTKLKVGASYDYAGGVNVAGPADPVNDGRAGYANAVALYANYQLTEKLSINGRGEYASSDTGAFLAKEVFATTATIQYDLWKNFISRVEFRWDHAADASNPYGGTVLGEGTKDNSFILLANIAYRF